MTESNGTRYVCANLAKVFKVDAADMRMMLLELVDQGIVELVSQARNKLYFIRTEAEKEKISAMTPALLAVKPYKQTGAAWDTVRERVADFRSGPSLYATLGST
jgi:hypothetical protein